MELTGEWPETKNRRCKLVENEKEKSDFFFILIKEIKQETNLSSRIP